jgi:hypothetical protein
MLLRRAQTDPARGFGSACREASAIAARAPGTRVRRALLLLGLVLMIVHGRPWSYTLFDAPQDVRRHGGSGNSVSRT